MVERAPQRRHDGGPRARAGAAERVFTIIRVVFMIRRRGRRLRLHLQMEGGCAFLPNLGWGGSRAARFCAAGEGPPVSHLVAPFRSPCAVRRVCCAQLDLVRCDVPSARRRRRGAGRERHVRRGVGRHLPVCVVASSFG